MRGRAFVDVDCELLLLLLEAFAAAAAADVVVTGLLVQGLAMGLASFKKSM